MWLSYNLIRNDMVLRMACISEITWSKMYVSCMPKITWSKMYVCQPCMPEITWSKIYVCHACLKSHDLKCIQCHACMKSHDICMSCLPKFTWLRVCLPCMPVIMYAMPRLKVYVPFTFNTNIRGRNSSQCATLNTPIYHSTFLYQWELNNDSPLYLLDVSKWTVK